MELKGPEHIKTVVRAFFPNCEFENPKEGQGHHIRCCQGFRYRGMIWNKKYHGFDGLFYHCKEYNTEKKLVKLMKKFKRGEE